MLDEASLQILMLGPAPEMQGGVSRVIRLMLNHSPKSVRYAMVSTTIPEKSLYASAHLKGTPLKYYFIGLQGVAYFIQRLTQLNKQLRKWEPDLAHIHFSSKGSTFRKYFVARLLHKHRVPYLMHAHGGGYREFYRRAPAWAKKRIYWMLSHSAGLIVLSEQWRDFYHSLLGECARPIWVMPNPVELPQHWQTATDDALKLLFLGRMGEHKGTDRILQAVARLPQSLRERVYLYMAGDGDVDAVRRLATELGLQARADIRDWIEGAEKERWLRETNAFILPSRAEGLPMAMLEAMAYGKALIVSPVGGIPEFVSDGQEGLLVPPDDIEAISQAIATLAMHPEKRVQMGCAARARVEPLDVKRYMQQILSIYCEVCTSS